MPKSYPITPELRQRVEEKLGSAEVQADIEEKVQARLGKIIEQKLLLLKRDFDRQKQQRIHTLQLQLEKEAALVQTERARVQGVDRILADNLRRIQEQQVGGMEGVGK